MICAARIFALVTLAVLAGCTAPTRPLMMPFGPDTTYGFVDKPVSGTEYEVSYIGPMIYTQLTIRTALEDISQTARATSHDLALARAGELAQQKGYKGFKVRAADGTVRRYIVGRDYENVPVDVFQNVVATRWELASWTYFRGESTLTVELTDDGGGEAYVAADIAPKLAEHYQAAIQTPIMAGTYYYFGSDAWLQGYDEEYLEAPVLKEPPKAKPGKPGKPLGQPYYIP